LDIKVLPDRAHDCFSHIGIAKELAAICDCQFIAPKTSFKEDKSLKIEDFISVEVKEKELCPRYSMMVAADVKIKPSPAWMQERLLACGLRPISNIVDITNYVMLETGQPLHGLTLIKWAEKIIVRRASPEERITTLEEKTYKLSESNLVIADVKTLSVLPASKAGKARKLTEKQDMWQSRRPILIR